MYIITSHTSFILLFCRSFTSSAFRDVYDFSSSIINYTRQVGFQLVSFHAILLHYKELQIQIPQTDMQRQAFAES